LYLSPKVDFRKCKQEVGTVHEIEVLRVGCRKSLDRQNIVV
jgi:hypothetical protein